MADANIQFKVVRAQGVQKLPRRATAPFVDPWAKLGPLRDRLAAIAIAATPTPPISIVPERTAPSSLVTSEDIPAAWLERLFNPGAIERVWSKLDALREAAAEEPLPSPHPRRLREYGRCRRGP